MVHMASLPSRMDDTKNMWAHMNSTRTRPVALWITSSLAGHRLLLARSARPAPAIKGLVCSIVQFPLFRLFSAVYLRYERREARAEAAPLRPHRAPVIAS